MGERASARTADVGAVPESQEAGATDVKGSQGKNYRHAGGENTERDARGQRPPSIPGAFASGYPSPMRSAAHNPTIMT